MLFVTILVDRTRARVNLDIQAMAEIALVRFFFFFTTTTTTTMRNDVT